jgi:hypothetical protein
MYQGTGMLPKIFFPAKLVYHLPIRIEIVKTVLMKCKFFSWLLSWYKVFAMDKLLTQLVSFVITVDRHLVGIHNTIGTQWQLGQGWMLSCFVIPRQISETGGTG